MIQLALCAVALAFAWRTDKLRDVAIVYAIVHVFFAIVAGEPSQAAKTYGQTWWYLCAAAEASIIIWTYGIKHDATAWVIWCSVYNMAVHLLASVSKSAMPTNPFWEGWNDLIRLGELSQIACIIVFSRPIWNRLQPWYHDRRLNKGKARWLARSIQAG